ncbi:50S ribosomal protein L34e [Candidatus Woesearchaeota archaeon]|nr:MAG: 50S ribosomal protein L34e [Candidatus Woesearchaeota archaeon]
MVAPRLRSRTLRRVFRKTPGGKTVVLYKRRAANKPRCGLTGQELHGVPRGTPSKIKALPKSKKRPQRPFGGVLSSEAMRRVLIERARALDQEEENLER